MLTLSSCLDQKLTLLFEALDYDGNGVIDEKDFDLNARTKEPDEDLEEPPLGVKSGVCA